MQKTIGFIFLFALLGVAFTARQEGDSRVLYEANTPLAAILHDLGQAKQPHETRTFSPEEVKCGEELFKDCRTKNPPQGKKSTYITKFYKCTSCHNLQREDPILDKPNPESRLAYVNEHNLPLLQGTTMWGIWNRESFYNGDYEKKYGEWVKAARNSLTESVQLCATACSQGRRLNDWELQAMLAYLQSLQLKLDDVSLSPAERAELLKPAKTASEKQAALTMLRTKYLTLSPANYLETPLDKRKGYNKKGDAANGKLVYDLSCRHCHRANGCSSVILDDSKLVHKQLKRNLFKANHWSLYEIIPHGTKPHEGAKPYMPMYPKERLSEQQVEDLRAYITLRAN